jgi:O-antigen ligase
MVLSVIWAVALPAQGIHQATDFLAGFAGLWRGIFAHRNILGYNAGLTIALLMFYGGSAFHSWLLRGGALIASVACLIGANSGSGFLVTFSLLALLSSVSLLRRLAPKHRLAMLALYSLVVALSTIFLNEIIAAALSILGKDPDLTGRAPYWHYLMALISEDQPMIGYGYYAGFALKIRPEIYSLTGVDFLHPHNGYLDVIIAFGYIGLAICIFVFAWLEWRAIRLIILSAERPFILNALPFALITFVICHNAIEPSFLAANSQVGVLLAWLTPRLVGLDMRRRQAT